MVPDAEARADGPELLIAFVSPLGTNLELVSDILGETLNSVDYQCRLIRFTELLRELEKWENLPDSPEDERLDQYMNAGNEFRKVVGRGDALAVLAVAAIRELRESVTGDPNRRIPRCAYLLRQLKHPDEVLTLRKIFDPGFFLVASYSPHERRVERLAKLIADSRHAFHSPAYRADAERLIQRDEAEVEVEFGQNVRDSFPLADVFVDVSDPNKLRDSLRRFVELIFGNTFHTPTRDEYAMFHAQAAALRSASLSRQVGSVISTEEGDIIAVGTNEVPKAGGGLYWVGDTNDRRDYRVGYDTSDFMKRKLLADTLERLSRQGWLNPGIAAVPIEDLVDKALAGDPSPFMRSAQLMNVLAFGRAVHAEMATLADAARRGVSVKGSSLYTTTFPCHDCARHIVAAGVKRVLYIEPYPKSLVLELHPDSVAVDTYTSGSDRVDFRPFVGIAPRRYMDLFTKTERKTRDGKVLAWKASQATPRFPPSSPGYLLKEEEEVTRLRNTMEDKGLRRVVKREVS